MCRCTQETFAVAVADARAAEPVQDAARRACIEPLLAGLGDAIVVAEAPPQAPQPPAAPAAGKLSLCYGGDEHTFDDVSPAKLFLLLSLVVDSSDFDAVEVEAQSPRQHRQTSLQRFKAKKHGRSHVKAEEEQKPRKLAPSREASPFSSGGRTSSSDAEGGDGGGKCVNCGVGEADTPLMRRGPAGPHTLCNACGLMYASHGVMRTPPGSRSRGQNPCRGKHAAAPAAAAESTRVLSLSHGFGQSLLQQPAGTPPMAQATAPPILPQLLLLPQTQHAPNLSGTPDASAAAAPPPQLFSGAAASPGFATPAPASGGAGSTSFIDSAAAASSPFTVPVLSVVAGLPTACSSPTTRPLQPLQDLPGVLHLGMAIDKAAQPHDAGGCSTKETPNDQGLTRVASANGLTFGGSLQRTPWPEVAV